MRDEIREAIEKHLKYVDVDPYAESRDLVLLGVLLGLEAAAKKCEELDDWRSDAWDPEAVDTCSAAHGAGKCGERIRAIEPAKVVE